jgi:hypothetical protein
LSEEAVDLAADGVEGALLIFAAVVDQQSAVLMDHIADKLFSAETFLRGGSSFTSRMISPPGSHILSTWFCMVLFDKPDPVR